MKGIIFDLDQTLIDSSIAQLNRNSGNWKQVYDLIPKFKLYDGIQELIEQLKEQNYIIGIVTTSPSNYADKVLNHFNICYDTKVCYHDVKRIKPFPDQFNIVIEKMNLNRNLTYSLGDRFIDILAAKRANIISCACYWGTQERELLNNSNPSLKFYSVVDALNYFKENNI